MVPCPALCSTPIGKRIRRRKSGAARWDRAGRRSPWPVARFSPRSSAATSEVVACYDADTGAQRWIHESPARFWESVAGAGPRATPTLEGRRLFAVGATGLVHCLDPSDGAVIWQRDLTKDAARKPLTWGFASSPLDC